MINGLSFLTSMLPSPLADGELHRQDLLMRAQFDRRAREIAPTRVQPAIPVVLRVATFTCRYIQRWEDVLPRYVIEHRTAAETRVITAGVHPLDPIARHLASLGQTGDVVLVEVDTREVIIRVPIVPLATAAPTTDDDQA